MAFVPAKTIISPEGSRIIVDEIRSFGTVRTDSEISNGCLVVADRYAPYPYVITQFIKPENRSPLCDKLAAFFDSDEPVLDLRLEPLALPENNTL